MLNGYKAFFEEVAKEYDFQTQMSPVPQGTTKASAGSGDEAQTEDDIYLTIAAPVLLMKVVATIVVFFMRLEAGKRRKGIFAFLELMTIVITVCSFLHGTGSGAFLLLAVGTVFNVVAVVFSRPDLGGGDGSSSGGYSSYSGSRGGFHYSGGSHHYGGGGSSGGGGSTRSF